MWKVTKVHLKVGGRKQAAPTQAPPPLPPTQWAPEFRVRVWEVMREVIERGAFKVGVEVPLVLRPHSYCLIP